MQAKACFNQQRPALPLVLLRPLPFLARGVGGAGFSGGAAAASAAGAGGGAAAALAGGSTALVLVSLEVKGMGPRVGRERMLTTAKQESRVRNPHLPASRR